MKTYCTVCLQGVAALSAINRMNATNINKKGKTRAAATTLVKAALHLNTQNVNNSLFFSTPVQMSSVNGTTLFFLYHWSMTHKLFIFTTQTTFFSNTDPQEEI